MRGFERGRGDKGRGGLTMLGAVAAIACATACVGELHENLATNEAALGDAGIEAAPTTPPGVGALEMVHFEPDIQSDIDLYGCTTNGCHGSSSGGFLLTAHATGANLDANYAAFKERASDGETSKVLVKPTSGSSHGGGSRFSKTDVVYERWLGWIRQGAPR